MSALRLIQEFLAQHPRSGSAAILFGVFLLGAIAHWLIFSVVRRIAQRSRTGLDDLLVRHARGPTHLLLPLVLVALLLPELPLSTPALQLGQRIVAIGLIATIGWALVGALALASDWVATRYRLDVSDNLVARRVQTQVRVLRHAGTTLVVLVAAALILMQIPSIEKIGVSLLASAGLAGIVVGMAARPAVSNLLAGVQLALSQPIRIDDAVLVEGEFGRIEEISNTFVVVQLWDQRRLVLPLAYFIEKPFQNWTRVTADLLGTVTVRVDYRVPVGEVRNQAERILQGSELWDKKVWNLQVTDASEHTLELRVLMSAADAARLWDLRCYVREQLVTFLQERFPEALPRLRAEVQQQQPRAAQPA